MSYFDPPDKTQSVLAEWPRPQFEFIGAVRYRLFADHDCEWNGVVREITANLERLGNLVNTEIVCVHLAEHYRIKAHWARFHQSISESRVSDSEGGKT